MASSESQMSLINRYLTVLKNESSFRKNGFDIKDFFNQWRKWFIDFKNVWTNEVSNYI